MLIEAEGSLQGGSLSRVLKALALVAIAAIVAACGSSNNNSSNASVRLVNATSAATLSVALNATSEFSGVPAGNASKYVSVGPGTYTVTVTSAGGTLTSSTQTLGLGSGQTFSLLAYERDGAIFTALVTENETAPSTGFGVLGLANLSPDSGPLDVYVVSPGAPIIGLAPTFQNVQDGAAALSTTLATGTYDVVATASGNVNDVRLRAASQAIGNQQIVSLGLTSTPGGALVNGVFLVQGGGVSFAPATNARARVVSALPTSGSYQVVATVGGTTLPAAFAGLPTSSYALVPGNATTYTVSISGTAVATLPPATFTTGGDFTILVYGTAAAPTVTVFTDNNQTPVAGEVNLRLVNAGVTATGGLSLYDNGVQVASQIAYGAASGYSGVGVANTTVLELIEVGVAPVTANEALSTPEAVYTIFVIDTTLTPYLVRDR
jgi:hypothetical protein